MARAKRTARADARRRHRADQSMSFDDTVAEPLEPSSTVQTRAGSATSKPTQAVSGRRGFAVAFREAFRPLDVRGDLAALPAIATRSKALWLPVLITLVATIIFTIVRPAETLATAKCSFDRLGDCAPLLSYTAFQYFVVTPAIGSVFLAGFLAPRASWLLGAIVGLVSAACYSYLVIAGFVPGAAGAPAPVASDVVLASISISPVLGALFASAAAWYRRFLMLTNPNRGRPRQSTGAGRRPDGRSRASTGQKAGVRR